MEARTCPSCGLSVAVGYARCPRCRASVGNAPPHGAGTGDPRGRRMSGPPSGTAVEAPRLSPRMIAAGAALALSALAVVLVSLGGDEPARPAAAARPPLSVEPAALQPAAPIAPAPVASTTATNAMSQTAAVEQLRRAFAKARLYSQISVQGAELELRSASCDDRQLADLLTRSRAALIESGLHRVRCLQPHGQVVFSREL